MIHLRMVAPPALAERVLAALERKASVINVIHLPGAARSPSGDVILCDVAREDASVVLAELRDLGLAEQGTIAIETVDTSISTAARAAEHAAAGAPSDAVVWEEVESRTSESAELSGSFLAFMVLATLIAGVGILTDSVILIIGAMVVGPEFGPLAGLCVALVHRRLALARRSLDRTRGRLPGRDRLDLRSGRSCSAPPTEAPTNWPTIRRHCSSRTPICSPSSSPCSPASPACSRSRPRSPAP